MTERLHFHVLEKEMAIHSSVLAWRIPRMGEPGGLPSMGSHRVEHDWSNLAAAAAEAWCKTSIALLKNMWENHIPKIQEETGFSYHKLGDMTQTAKNLSGMHESLVQSMGWEDSSLEGNGTSTPVFLPGKPHGQRRLVGYCPWGDKE